MSGGWRFGTNALGPTNGDQCEDIQLDKTSELGGQREVSVLNVLIETLHLDEKHQRGEEFSGKTSSTSSCPSFSIWRRKIQGKSF